LRDGSAEARFVLGTVVFMAKDYPNALKEFGQAININPNLDSLFSYYSQALLFTGDAEGAATALRRQLASDTNDFDANLRLAQILFRRREYAHARAFYERPCDCVHAQPRLLTVLHNSTSLPSNRKTRIAALKKSYPDGCSMPTRTARSQSLMKNLVSNRKPFASARLQPRRNGVSGNGGLSMGSPAPDFDLPESSGDRHMRLSDFRGKRPTLLVLGATLVLIFVLIWGL